jgi:hypothetical protein
MRATTRAGAAMNRTLLALLTASLALPAAAFNAISLDRPGALEAIEAANPDHHQRILGILRASQEMPCASDYLYRLVVDYDARDAKCSRTLLTSLPAKRRLSFSLDGQAYVATVQMNERARLVKVSP